jgi:hypothetical protein
MRHRINNADWKNIIAIQQSALPGAQQNDHRRSGRSNESS